MKTNQYLLRSTLVAALGSFLFGFDTAVISGTTEALRQVFHLTSSQLGFTVASALVGTILGSLLAGKPAELLGRKRTLTLLAIFYFVTSLGCGLAWNWASLLIFRFTGGIAIGVASVVSPMYIAEIAPPESRGRLVAVSQFNTVLGILVAYFTNYIIALVFAGSGAEGSFVAWRWMFGILAAPVSGVLLPGAADSGEPALVGEAASSQGSLGDSTEAWQSRFGAIDWRDFRVAP